MTPRIWLHWTMLATYLVGGMVLPVGHVHQHGESCHRHAVVATEKSHSHSHGPHEHSQCGHHHETSQQGSSEEIPPTGVPSSDDDCPVCDFLNTPAHSVSFLQLPLIAQSVDWLLMGESSAATFVDLDSPPLRGPPLLA